MASHSLATLQKIDKTTGIMTFVNGAVGDKSFWALMSIYPSKYNEYVEKVSLFEEISLTDYGQVMESGYGIMPEKAKLEMLSERYGADYRFL